MMHYFKYTQVVQTVTEVNNGCGIYFLLLVVNVTEDVHDRWLIADPAVMTQNTRRTC